MPIFCEVDLNDQGRIAEKNDRKVCVVFFHLDCSTFSLLVTGFRLQRLAASEQAGKQAQRRVRQQQAATSETTNPLMRLGVPGPAPHLALLRRHRPRNPRTDSHPYSPQRPAGELLEMI
jgi:hypothetical protein